jgi:hypothetical protein
VCGVRDSAKAETDRALAEELGVPAPSKLPLRGAQALLALSGLFLYLSTYRPWSERTQGVAIFYWAAIVHGALAPYLALIAVGATAILLFGWIVSRLMQIRKWSLGWAAVCTATAIVPSCATGLSTDLRHESSVHTEQGTFHLATRPARTSEGGHYYALYECDAWGVVCTLRQGIEHRASTHYWRPPTLRWEPNRGAVEVDVVDSTVMSYVLPSIP